MEPIRKRRKYSSWHCPHCRKSVSKSTWYRHYAEFYDNATASWKEEENTQGSDFNFSDTSESDEADYIVECDEEDVSIRSENSDDASDPLEIWESDSDEYSDTVVPNSTDNSAQENNCRHFQLIKFIITFILSWQALFRIPNVAIGLLLKFMSTILNALTEMSSQTLAEICKYFPDNLKKAHTIQSIQDHKFSQLIVCPKCSSTYEPADLPSTRESPTCSHIRFPRHPFPSMRVKCGEKLMKAIKTSKGRQILAPKKVFGYRSIIDCLKCLIQRPGILDILSEWKMRKIPEGVLSDIYDGEMWKSFLCTDDRKELLASRYTFGLLLNTDWFQPFKHVPYSTGALYISILNFPRHLRYSQGNTFVVGLIPGPHEPKLHMNSFLEHLVHELLLLWKGVLMQTPEGEKEVKAVLLCVSCDVPASRKIGGFLGHSALKGCSRCLKSFPTNKFGEKSDYSGFNRCMWEPRCVSNHRQQGMSWKHALSLTERKQIEREHGVRFTELLRLPYFDTIRSITVDPMHNMLLGTSKHIVNIWKSQEIFLTDFGTIQLAVDKFVTPAGVGRIPHKIMANFSSFTADQWKNWVVIYSLVVLKGRIPDEHYECWCLFVDACHLICSRAITRDNVKKMDDLIINFCKKFEELYGSKACTPNIHLHCHLKECLLDFGPACSFWTFAFERLNGILGSYPTNHRAIEVQLMKKFCVSQQVMEGLRSDETLSEIFSPYQSFVGSLKQTMLPELPISSANNHQAIEISENTYRYIHPVKEACLNSEEHSLIDDLLKQYVGPTYIRTLLLYKYSRAIEWNGDLYGSLNSIHSSSAMVYIQSTENLTTFPAFARKYLKVNALVTANGETSTRTFHLVAINQLQVHPHKNWFHSSLQVWRVYTPNPLVEAFFPVVTILYRCAYLVERVKFSRCLEEEVTIIVPVYNYFGLK